MAKQSKLLMVRNQLKSRCNNYFNNLYDKEVFAEFRRNAINERNNINDKFKENETLKEAYQIKPNTFISLKNKQKKINDYLEEQDDLLFVIKCLDNNYTPFEYAFSTYGISNIESVLPRLKSLQRLLNCFVLNENNIEITPDKQQIYHFAQTFSKEKGSFKFDTNGQKFLEAIGHILASVLTGGFYAGIRAGYSYHKRKSPVFWKSQPELIKSELDDALKETKTQ